MARALVLLTLLLALLLAPPTAHAQGGEAEAVAIALENVAALIERGDIEGARLRLEAMERAGQIRAAPWLTRLDEEPELVATQLRASAALLRAPPTELPTDAERRLERILDTLTPFNWQRWLFDLLDRFLSATGGPWVEIMRWLFTCVGVGMGIALLLFLLRQLRRLRPGRARPSEMEGDLPTHAEGAQAQAVTAAGAGDFREAMRLLYLAALLHLDEVGRLRFDRALTNQEVLASVRDDGALRALLAPVVSQFDRVWYGHAPFGAEEFALMEGQLTRLRQMEGAR